MTSSFVVRIWTWWSNIKLLFYAAAFCPSRSSSTSLIATPVIICFIYSIPTWVSSIRRLLLIFRWMIIFIFLNPISNFMIWLKNLSTFLYIRGNNRSRSLLPNSFRIDALLFAFTINKSDRNHLHKKRWNISRTSRVIKIMKNNKVVKLPDI